MTKRNKFDLGQICFGSDSIQVLSISRNNSVLELPLNKAPINFSVLRSDGLSSNLWGVRTSRNGDAYVYCRDVPDAEKVSLHASGRQHISVTSKVAERRGSDSRFGPVWEEPEFEREAIATFRLIFPPWGVGVRYEPKELTKDELLIVGHSEKLVVVNFFIVDSTKRMECRLPYFVLGQVPLRPGKTLYIIAWKEPQKDLAERIRSVFPHISQTFSERELGEDDYTMCFQGHRGPNSAFMITVPVHYTPPLESTIVQK